MGWQSQVDFFHKAIKLSPTGGIDAVVVNAGTTDTHSTFERSHSLDAGTPPEPNLLAFNVDLVGVLYTAQLAIFYLPRNARSESVGLSSDSEAHRRLTPALDRLHGLIIPSS